MAEEAQRQRTSSASSSPEFEFWMVRNPSFPSTDLLTADELIVDGVVVPLHLLSLHRSHPWVFPTPDPPPYPPVHIPADPQPPPCSVLSSSLFSPAPASGSKRWIDIFKVAGEKKPEGKERERERKDRRASAATDLNINLNFWPFSRSHSAGNPGIRPRSSSIATRKVCSAPCSRSNSRGESSAGGRRSASSPSRAGVYLNRPNPACKFRRTGPGAKEKGKNTNAASHSVPGVGGNGSATGSGRLLNLNVNSCIGYQNQVSCRDDDSDGLPGRTRAGEASASGGSIFNIRALFAKKVY